MTNPRSAMTATGRSAVKVKVPSHRAAAIKGSLVQESCDLFPGPQRESAVSGVDAIAVGEEERDRGGRVVGVGQARPVRTGPAVSAKIRPSRTAAEAGTPASEDENPVEPGTEYGQADRRGHPGHRSPPVHIRRGAWVPRAWEVTENPPRSGRKTAARRSGRPASTLRRAATIGPCLPHCSPAPAPGRAWPPRAPSGWRSVPALRAAH